MNYAEYKRDTYNEMLKTVIEIIDEEGLKGKNNKHCLTNKRHYLIWFLKENTGEPYADIGELFEMSHSSTLQASRKHNDFMEFTSERYINNIKVIQRYLLKKFPNAINIEINK